MQAQTEAAIAAADAVFFLVDARAGPDAGRSRLSRNLVRRSGKPAILVANKSEGRAGDGRRARSLCARSRRSGRDLGRARRRPRRPLRGAAQRLARADARHLPASEPRDDRPARPIRVAVVGRPNTGKSTLINRLLGEERLLTGPEAGITRDAIAVDSTGTASASAFTTPPACAGASRIEEKLEKLSVADALNAIRFAEVVIVLDGRASAVRGAGPAHRRPGRARGPRARHRHEQVGPGRTADRRAIKKLREETEHWLPQVKGVPVVGGVGAHRRGPRPADAGGDRGARGLEQARADERAQPLARRGRPPRIRRPRSPAGASGSTT